MFVPIGDENPLKSIRFQYVTVALIALNVIVFFLESAGGPSPQFISSFAVVPQEFFQVAMLGGSAPHSGDVVPVPERATLLTYMFFHGDVMHLLGNMLFLWVFGDNVEDAMGHVRFAVFYLACGVIAALTHAAMLPDSNDALIGASGAVSGVIAAYLMLHPKVSVWVLALKIIPLKINAGLVLGLWIITQLVMVALPQVDATAWWAHIGGLIAGALLILVMRRRGVPLFDQGLSARVAAGSGG
ncbi:MAG: rhomboid family intramembrane serine protease [Hyphomicrobium sp.]